MRVLAAERREQHLRLLSVARTDRVAREIAEEKLAAADATLARARERISAVLIRSPSDGVFVLPGGEGSGEGLVGRYVEQGAVVAYVVDLRLATARVVVPQRDVALLRDRTRAVWLRFEHDLGTVLPVSVAREVPVATDRLPTSALGTAGGGPFAVDPADPDGLRTLESVFQFDLALPSEVSIRAAGERVHVRFDHGAEPVVQRGYRAVRRLFLRQLGV